MHFAVLTLYFQIKKLFHFVEFGARVFTVPLLANDK